MDINQNYREAVKSIKEAILRSQYRAAASVNKEQLSLYYGIGRYVSENSRTGFWGKGAIEQISSLLQKELPGLRGFSASNIKNMRIFYEAWESVLNRQPLADDLVLDEKLSDYPFMHLLYSQLLVCQRVCLQNTVCLICK